ncbi:MAG: hypothetical protein OFPI_08610 [Osedax symbiont Rs2]|nr:MAG: hypothetical protein OFPI_08610 [Osedax symbiont Rs2]
MPDKAGGRFIARPLGLTEHPNLVVIDFRQATSIPVVDA